MKKIDKIDMFLFVCILLGCVFGLATMMSGWILGEQIIWLQLLTAIFFGLPSCALMGGFASDVLGKIISNHKEKKKSKEKDKMKKSNIFFDLCAIFTILGIVIWNIIAIYYLITGKVIPYLSSYGFASFLLAMACLVIAAMILVVKLSKEKMKNRRKTK